MSLARGWYLELQCWDGSHHPDWQEQFTEPELSLQTAWFMPTDPVSSLASGTLVHVRQRGTMCPAPSKIPDTGL